MPVHTSSESDPSDKERIHPREKPHLQYETNDLTPMNMRPISANLSSILNPIPSGPNMHDSSSSYLHPSHPSTTASYLHPLQPTNGERGLPSVTSMLCPQPPSQHSYNTISVTSSETHQTTGPPSNVSQSHGYLTTIQTSNQGNLMETPSIAEKTGPFLSAPANLHNPSSLPFSNHPYDRYVHPLPHQTTSYSNERDPEEDADDRAIQELDADALNQRRAFLYADVHHLNQALIRSHRRLAKIDAALKRCI